MVPDEIKAAKQAARERRERKKLEDEGAAASVDNGGDANATASFGAGRQDNNENVTQGATGDWAQDNAGAAGANDWEKAGAEEADQGKVGDWHEHVQDELGKKAQAWASTPTPTSPPGGVW